ncbi:hypothetical protein V7199_21735 [Priestia megaterium]|uniref:hypothetical protein n=2 Tax=Priestia megaterium TaxID=1404 RepID=UPI00300B6D28
MFLEKSYGEFHSKFQIDLEDRLKKEKIEETVIQKVLESGFYIFQDYVQDGYYGSRGAIPFNYFVNILKGTAKNYKRRNIPTYIINSFEEAKKVLEQPFYKNVINDICFRGQTNHVNSTRPFPHPFFANENGEEILLLPGFWRTYLDDNKHVSNKRPMEAPRGIANEIISERMLYHGIDVQKLIERNLELYGHHDVQDLEDFPDRESQEYYRRYNLKFSMMKGFEQSLIEQHYGFPTIGLDVSFDLKTALFFATNKFVIKKGKGEKANYIPINHSHEGVIYLLRFSSPKIMKTRDQILATSIFEHIPPIRPLKQSCALPFFHSTMVNEAAAHIVGILKIGEDFNDPEAYTPSELFPSRKEDLFYNALLELKEELSKEFPEELNKIIDYDFTS